MMNDITDAISILNLDAWTATETGVLSYIKTPIQQTFFHNNSQLIGQALRQSIIYFAETINTVDRASCVLGNEYRSTRTHKYQVLRPHDEKTPENTTTPMEITTFAPIAFENMRSIIGITRNSFQSSFNDGDLVDFTNTGRSGSQMYKTQDDVYVIKTLRDHEAKLLLQALPGFYLRYSHSSSVMTRYVGLYSVNIRSIFPSEIFCVVMMNNLPSMLDIHEIYDMKGSRIGRHSTVDHPSKQLKALKDLDLESFYPHGIRIPHDIYRRLRPTLEADISELRKLMITDFSLMLGVYHLDQLPPNEENTPRIGIPQLGIGSLVSAVQVNGTVTETEHVERTPSIPDEKLMDRFHMKPMHLITCPQEETFADNIMASSLLGIPGLTHDGRRVLLYPALIDCLQTFDNFKRMQHVIQNIRDPKHGTEYSVIHPNEYEKRLVRFLFERVFIDSKQTLEELLASPNIPTDFLSNGHSNQQRESFDIIQPAEVLETLAFQSLTSTDNETMISETTVF